MVNNIIKGIINRLKKSKLVENFFYLTGLQFFNYLLPLITLPYLISVLQPEKFGLTVYAQTVMMYFIVFIDYGFNLTATRRISLLKNENKSITEVFNSVISTKLFLLLISLLILTLIVLFIPKFSGLWLLYFFTSGVLIGQVFFPIWLFQGLQEMKYLMYFNFLSRIIFTILVFIIIKTEEDFIYVNLLSSLGSILIGILSIAFVIKKYKIRFQISKRSDIEYELKDGWMVFLSNFSIQMYVSSNIIILGAFENDKTVGNYSVAEKLMIILKQLLSVFSQVIYPHLCQLTDTPNLIKSFFKRTMIPFLSFIFVLCLLLFVFAEKIVFLMTGNSIPEIILLIRILCFVPFVVGLNIPAYQTLLAYNYKNAYSAILISGAVLNFILNFILAGLYGANGTAISVLITEFFITTGLIFALKIKLKNTVI